MTARTVRITLGDTEANVTSAPSRVRMRQHIAGLPSECRTDIVVAVWAPRTEGPNSARAVTPSAAIHASAEVAGRPVRHQCPTCSSRQMSNAKGEPGLRDVSGSSGKRVS